MLNLKRRREERSEEKLYETHLSIVSKNNSNWLHLNEVLDNMGYRIEKEALILKKIAIHPNARDENLDKVAEKAIEHDNLHLMLDVLSHGNTGNYTFKMVLGYANARKNLKNPTYRIFITDSENQNSGIYLTSIQVKGSLMVPQNDFFNLMSSIAETHPNTHKDVREMASDLSRELLRRN